MTSTAESSKPQSETSIGIPLTVIMPAYNEADGILSAISEVKQEVLDKVAGANLLVINDGSKDETANILDAIAKDDPRVRVIHQSNMGHGPSLVRALKQANSTYVFLIDSDMQVPLNCFSDLWKLANNADAVIGIRTNREDPIIRLILSKIAAIIINAMFKVEVPDSNSPCKLLKRNIWENMNNCLCEDKLIAPSMLLAIYAKKHGYRVIYVPVPHRARTTGKPSLNLVSLIRFCRDGLEQLMRFKDKLS